MGRELEDFLRNHTMIRTNLQQGGAFECDRAKCAYELGVIRNRFGYNLEQIDRAMDLGGGEMVDQ